MSSQRDIKKTLSPNQSLPVDVQGEFYFVKKCAQEISIVVHNQTQIGIEGDSARFVKPFENLTLKNTSGVTLEVVLVVGYGAYNRNIINGQVSLLEHMKTNALGNYLPVSFTRRMGVESAERTAYVQGDNLAVFNQSDSGEGPHLSAVVYDDQIWQINQKGIRRFDFDGNVVDELVFDVAIAHELHGATVGEDGRVFVLVKPSSGNANISEIDLRTGVFIDGGDTGISVHWISAGIEYRKGYIYFSEYNANGPVMFRKKASSLANTYSVGQWDTDRYMVRYDKDSDEIWFTDGSGTIQKIDPETGVVKSSFYLAAYSNGYSSIIIDEELNRQITLHGHVTYFNVQSDIVYKAKLWSQEGDDVSTKRVFYTAAEVSFFDRGNSTIMQGEIVSAMLQAIEINARLRTDYLDYVSKIIYTDGHYNLEQSAGSASFSYRGYGDKGRLLMESDFTLSLHPQYLTEFI